MWNCINRLLLVTKRNLLIQFHTKQLNFSLPTAGSRAEFSHSIFTQPGNSLLVQPCTVRTWNAHLLFRTFLSRDRGHIFFWNETITKSNDTWNCSARPMLETFRALQALLVLPFDFLCGKNFCYFGPVFQYEKHEPPKSFLAFGQYSDWRPLRRTSGCHFFAKFAVKRKRSTSTLKQSFAKKRQLGDGSGRKINILMQ